MEDHIVLYRQYRPLTFDDVVGQEAAVTALRQSIASKKLAHAYLFCGQHGTGKTTIAKIFARAVNCEHPVNGNPCNECPTCKGILDGSILDVTEMDAASNNGVDDIRPILQEVNFAPTRTTYKVYIIDEVHMLSPSAFNAFLKTLEEPPAYAKFILATTEKHKIIPTILSRCQVFDFKRIQSEDIVAYLKGIAEKEGVHYEEESLHIIARKAEGGLRDALSIFDQLVSFTRGNLTRQLCNENLNLLDADYYFRLVDYFRAGDLANTLLCYQEVIDKGYDGQHFITGLSEHLRNLMVSIDPATLKLLEGSEAQRARFGQQAAACGLPLLLRWLDISSDYEYRYKDAGNKRLFVEVALMKLSTTGVAAQNAASAPVPS